MGKLIDADRLVEHLEERMRSRSPHPAPLLVQHAIYEGLAVAVRRGDFDPIVNEDPDLVMGVYEDDESGS